MKFSSILEFAVRMARHSPLAFLTTTLNVDRWCCVLPAIGSWTRYAECPNCLIEPTRIEENGSECEYADSSGCSLEQAGCMVARHGRGWCGIGAWAFYSL